MRSFISALSFLTIIPLRPPEGHPKSSALLYFPIVGLLIGGLLAGVDWLGSLILYDELRALVDVAFLAFITGGLHLDGLADSADGLYFHHNREKALEIMKDPRVGVMGVLALIFCVGFKVAGLRVLEFNQCWIWFLVGPGLARLAQVAGLVFMNHARSDGGVGSVLYQKGKIRYLILGWVPLALPFWVSVPLGLIVAGLFVVSVACLLLFFRWRLGGITGDTLGASTEIIETLFLVFGGVACQGMI